MIDTSNKEIQSHYDFIVVGAGAAGSSGYRAALVRRQLTPGLISSLSGTAGLPPFISF